MTTVSPLILPLGESAITLTVVRFGSFSVEAKAWTTTGPAWLSW